MNSIDEIEFYVNVDCGFGNPISGSGFRQTNDVLGDYNV